MSSQELGNVIEPAAPSAVAAPAAAAVPLASPHPGDGRIERYVGTLLLLALAIGCLVVLRPFVSALLWAIILTFSTWPAYLWFERALGGRRAAAASAMVAAAAALLLVPLVALGSHLAGQVTQIATIVGQWMEKGPPGPPPWVRTLPLVGARLDAYWQTIAYDGAKLTAELSTYVAPARQWILNTGLSLGAGITELAVSLLIAFFLYRDGSASVHAVNAALGRIGGANAARLMAVAGHTAKGVVYGIVGTNLIEALLATFGLLITGVPGSLFLGFAIFFLTLIPLAPAIIFIPAIIWLAHQGATVSAIFLVVLYVLVFMILEGVLRAFFIARGGDLPLILVFLGIVGGVLAFGLLGVFVGPTLLALGVALLRDWNAAEKDLRPVPGAG